MKSNVHFRNWHKGFMASLFPRLPLPGVLEAQFPGREELVGEEKVVGGGEGGGQGAQGKRKQKERRGKRKERAGGKSEGD